MKTIFETDLSKITMDNYISVVLEGKFMKIVKRKGYDFYFNKKIFKKSLKEAVQKILQNYQDLSKDNNSSAFFLLTKDAFILSNEIKLGSVLVESLKISYNEETIRVLKKCGYKFKFSKESYKSDCKKVESLLKNKYLLLTKINKELIPFTEGKELDRNEYLDLASVLSKYQGYRIDFKEITVSEFISIFNNYKQWLTAKK